MQETCPICQRNNHCGISNLNEACWCTNADFASIDVQKLNLSNACICAHCAEKLGSTTKHTAT